MKHLNRIYAIFLLIVLAACGGGGETEEQFEGTTPEQVEAFETNLALWEAADIENYDFTYELTQECEGNKAQVCPEQLGLPARVSVRNGEVNAAQSADETEISSEEMVGRVPDIDSIFSNLDNLIGDSAGKYSLEVAYDETLGYPVENDITCLDADPNCASGISVTGFEEITP